MILAGFTVLGISIFHHPDTILQLVAAGGFQFGDFFPNIAKGFAPVFAWHSTTEGVFLSPLLSLPCFALGLIGLLSTTKGFFASRNSIASMLLLFTLIVTGFNPNSVVFILLPFSILMAHGLKYIFEKWYGLFPENPYARISALLPLTVLFGIMIIPGLLQYIYGYRYNPSVADSFSNNVEIIRRNLSDQTLLVRKNYEFYRILEASTDLKVIDHVEENQDIAVLGKFIDSQPNYTLSKIITSPRRDDSDIIYLYTYTEKGE
jgi:hypothetical protein